MKSSDFRNVVFLGHGGSGKTSLAEAMLFNAKAIDRLGRITDGNTALDYDQEETKRNVSINTALAPYDWNGARVNIIDTPGYFDFVGEMLEGVQVADSAVIVVAGTVAVGTEKAWDCVNSKNIPRAFYFNKLNDETADFEKLYTEIKSLFGNSCVALQLPIRKDRKLAGYVDTVTRKAKLFDKSGKLVDTEIPDELKDEVDEIHMNISEAVAESDDMLMEKFFGGEMFTEEEIIRGLKKAINACICAPVLIGAAYENMGVRELSDFLVNYMPSPTDRGSIQAKDAEGNDVVLAPDAAGAPAAFVFKTIADPFVGRLSLFRVYSGTIKGDSVLFNSAKGADERIAQVFNLRGKKQLPVSELIAGDIGAVSKLSVTATNDTLCTKTKPVFIDPIVFPAPQISLAITPKAKGDEEKISQGLSRLQDEDPTFRFAQDAETSQMMISGVGEQHLDIIVNKLKAKYSVSVDLTDPKIAYREAIRKRVEVEGKHKKQSGGHGQYGHVKIIFEPGEKPGLEFGEKVFGGAVPKNYFPAVEKGLQDSIRKGVLAGYPMVGLKATLVDGSYHPVDSSEMAFKVAASLAYKKGLPMASPVLLEPVMSVSIVVPDDYTGAVMGDLNKRRGRVLGMNPLPKNMQEIVAEVPYAEMFKYATDLRSMTQARGSFTSEFVRYDEVPANIAQKIIDEAKKNMSDDDED